MTKGLPVVAFNKPVNSVIVDFSVLLSYGFFVVGFEKPEPEARMSLDECWSFPNNMYITVNYKDVR